MYYLIKVADYETKSLADLKVWGLCKNLVKSFVKLLITKYSNSY